ncbi:MAG: hypothetical protein AB8H79_24300 [Myxococcota bacterium]
MTQVDPSIETRARLAAALGLLALSLVMLSPCSCGGTLPVGGIMGLGCMLFAMRVRASGPSRAGKAYALSGQYAGAIAATLVGLTLLLAMGSVILSMLSWLGIAELVKALG